MEQEFARPSVAQQRSGNITTHNAEESTIHLGVATSTPTTATTTTASSPPTVSASSFHSDPSNYVKSIVYGGLDGIITMFGMCGVCKSCFFFFS
jgi:hypothetical protein